MKLKKGDIKCPSCNSEVFYKYGRSQTGKQRYRCLICNRQFIPEARRFQVVNKPVCPKCGRLTHLYKRDVNYIRFRCSAYPKCKTYIKMAISQ